MSKPRKSPKLFAKVLIKLFTPETRKFCNVWSGICTAMFVKSSNAMDLFSRAMQITDPNRGEFIIFSDASGVSALVYLPDSNKKGAKLS